MNLEWAVLDAFLAVYLGMALGRWPGFAIDRTGVTLIGAIFLFSVGAVDGAFISGAIDFPTLATASRELPFDLRGQAAMAVFSIVGSNSIGNVPPVTLLLSLDLNLEASSLYALALFSTRRGNLLIVGSIANIIAVQRAREDGIEIGFFEQARIGIPVTLASLAVSYAWLSLIPLPPA